MQIINCNAVNCSHNKERVCYSNRINIVGINSNTDGNTSCASFLDSQTYGTLTNNVFQNGEPCDCLVCNVNSCKYNENQLCSLDSINISGNGANLYSETNCESFSKK